MVTDASELYIFPKSESAIRPHIEQNMYIIWNSYLIFKHDFVQSPHPNPSSS